MNDSFMKGLELSGLFYEQAVRPILAGHFAQLKYSAGLMGPGSEVLGFDTPQSMDHDWGPRLMLFVSQADHETSQREIEQVLSEELPGAFCAYPTNFGEHEDGTRVMAASEGGPTHHGVTVHTVAGYFRQMLNFDPAGKMRAVDWLSVPEYCLLMLTAGRVFYDGLGQLEPMRARLRYYPDEIWLYLLAAQWRRIAQEEAFVGRCGQAGDDLGSRLVAARLVGDLMRLCFLMERKYAPYIKWLGSAFGQLACAREMMPMLRQVLEGGSWEVREAHLARAYTLAAEMHNGLGITAPLTTEVSLFYKRPFRVIHAERFVDAIRGAIQSEEVRALPEHLGSVDQFIDSTDAGRYLERLRGVYGEARAA